MPHGKPGRHRLPQPGAPILLLDWLQSLLRPQKQQTIRAGLTGSSGRLLLSQEMKHYNGCRLARFGLQMVSPILLSVPCRRQAGWPHRLITPREQLWLEPAQDVPDDPGWMEILKDVIQRIRISLVTPVEEKPKAFVTVGHFQDPSVRTD